MSSSLSPVQTQNWELGVSLILHYWPALSTAVQSGWGGPDSSDKRDWFAGTIADMVWERDMDEIDLEEVLGQIMEDEFEVVVEDGSLEVTARRIMVLKEDIIKNDFSKVEKLHAQFLEKGGKECVPLVHTENAEEDEDDDDDEDGDEDEDMPDQPDAQPHVQVMKPEPVIDEDGFELVQKKKGRK
ncbi:hypothetical protein BJ508DRAFT_416356 [Ascobolus immersus RN42]|uniref:Pre-rRNA-processing protein TSR2 n=1 Tax=Ascobolus immersus RN42 TaxID=1160509 RepID=A0A3N4I3T8_ASCIM|nr:hypothetical protein BJ508DRAFT_416356 [Ascobolus immersus RN42]